MRTSPLVVGLLLGLAMCQTAHAARTAPTAVFAKTVVAAPVTGTITVLPPGAKKTSRLRRAQVVRVGTTLDATKGRVRIRAAMAKRGRRAEAIVEGGAFVVRQPKGDRGLVDLQMSGGGISCAAPYGAANAQRLLRLRTRGGFQTRGCFSRVRPTTAPPGAARARAAQAPTGPGTAGPVVTWAVWEYPNGWKIQYTGTAWLEVTDLVTNSTQRVHRTYLYEYIYDRRPPLPPSTPSTPPQPPAPESPPTPATAILDPLGDLLPCGFATCDDVDLRAASLTVSGGDATFTVEGYTPFPSGPDAFAPTLDFQIWKAAPGTGTGLLAGDYHVHLCKRSAATNNACPAQSTSVIRMDTYDVVGTPGSWAQPAPTVIEVTWPLAAIGSPTEFWWAAGSETCGWRDKIPDTGGIHHPTMTKASRRDPIGSIAC